MTRKPKPPAEKAHVEKAKGLAREAIGKLIGDDQEIREGRNQQRADLHISKSKTTRQE